MGRSAVPVAVALCGCEPDRVFGATVADNCARLLCGRYRRCVCRSVDLNFMGAPLPLRVVRSEPGLSPDGLVHYTPARPAAILGALVFRAISRALVPVRCSRLAVVRDLGSALV